jgi:hypothetical protein
MAPNFFNFSSSLPTAAQLVEQSTSVPKFAGSNPASAVSRRKLEKKKYFLTLTLGGENGILPVKRGSPGTCAIKLFGRII